ncbi:ATP-binding protein [Bacteriovorax sp. BSW11_IV]|uniref:ATP-binding protein n=1 Tax=Bacteriovorax sp. BSW11_IV TaxID=1353529 RepID=UPI0006970D5A|nr:ATP-binding protein [Bacteriovorax sp. BSW11_IV]
MIKKTQVYVVYFLLAGFNTLLVLYVLYEASSTIWLGKSKYVDQEVRMSRFQRVDHIVRQISSLRLMSNHAIISKNVGNIRKDFAVELQQVKNDLDTTADLFQDGYRKNEAEKYFTEIKKTIGEIEMYTHEVFDLIDKGEIEKAAITHVKAGIIANNIAVQHLTFRDVHRAGRRLELAKEDGFLEQKFNTLFFVGIVILISILFAIIFGLRLRRTTFQSAEEIKNKNDEIIKQRDFFETILNHMIDGLVVQDSKGTMVKCNKSAEILLSKAPDRLLGANAFDGSWRVKNISGEWLEPNEFPSMKALLSRTPTRNAIVSVNDERRWLMVNSAPYFEGNSEDPSLVISTIRDITPQRELEQKVRDEKERLDLAITSSGIGVWDWDIDVNEVSWTDHMYEIYDVQKGVQDLRYLDWENRLHPEDLPRIKSLLDDVLVGLRPYDCRFRVVRANGEIRHVRGVAKVYFDEAGKAKRMNGVNWDITSQIEHELVLKEARDRAEMASKAKSEFLANMSHEIRTPMHGILGMVGLLMDTKLSEDQLDMIKTIKSSGDGLMAILNDVLDFSKIESGKLELLKEEFKLRETINEIASLFSFEAQRKKISLSVNFDEHCPNVVVGDAVRIRQIILNLVSNGVKFTKVGGVSVQVSPILIEGAGAGVRIDVKDTGIGISEEGAEKIFKTFSQGDSSITREFGGTGLGLAISSKLAALMGGKVYFKSKVGEGSTFTFEVPLEYIDSAIEDAQDLIFPVEEFASKSYKILVAEDNEINQKIAKMMLEKLGHVAVFAFDGLDALNILERESFDFILMDIQMPQMDGISATKAILEKYGNAAPPIIAMTANVFSEDRERCFSAGMQDFIPKPVTHIELEKVIARLNLG